MTIFREDNCFALTQYEQQIAAKFIHQLLQLFEDRLRLAILFGSRARGEAESESDMDILLVFNEVSLETQKAIRFLAADYGLEHGIDISTRVWSLEHWQKLGELQTLLYQNIQRDGIDLLALAA